MNNVSKTKITAEQVIEIIRTGSTYNEGNQLNFQGNGNDLKIENLEVLHSLSIQSPQAIQPRNIFFIHCDFKHSLIFTNFSNIITLMFLGCKFEDDVLIKDPKGTLDIRSNCQFLKKCNIEFVNYRDLNVIDSTFIDNLTVSGLYHSIKFDNINVAKKKELPTAKLIFKNAIIRASNFNDINFNAVFIGDNTIFENEGNFTEINCDQFSINHAWIGHQLNLTKSNIQYLFIDNVDTKVKPDKPHRYIKLSDNCSISKASIALHMLDNTIFENSFIFELNLWGNNESSSIVKISYCTLKKFLFSDVINKGTISLRGIKIKEKGIIGFIDSDLGEMDFIKCDFSSADLDFQNSKISESFISESFFPKKVFVGGKRNYTQARLAYGQLRMAFQKQGDTVNSLEYHSREIEAHYNNIRLWSPDFFTTINLWLNLISNYFGRWWWLGMGVTLIIGVISFLCLLFTMDGFHFSLTGKVWEYTDSFWKFMNPLRHFDTQTLFDRHDNIQPTSWTYTIDFLARVFIAFGYYQTIQAFRRYGRK
jgi:uncharacterized protein YjbI with pentapeptide repeats